VTEHIGDGGAREGLPREKIRLIPNGVSYRVFAGVDRESARRRMGLADYCVIGFAGSFQMWHATGLLVSALEGLRHNRLWRLLLVGDGPACKPTLAKLDSLGLGARVAATGTVSPEAVPELITCFDIGVLPGSNDYGHPMKLLEYAAAGAIGLLTCRPCAGSQHLSTGLLFTPATGISWRSDRCLSAMQDCAGSWRMKLAAR
jgi:hypothetical protein